MNKKQKFLTIASFAILINCMNYKDKVKGKEITFQNKVRGKNEDPSYTFIKENEGILRDTNFVRAVIEEEKESFPEGEIKITSYRTRDNGRTLWLDCSVGEYKRSFEMESDDLEIYIKRWIKNKSLECKPPMDVKYILKQLCEGVDI